MPKISLEFITHYLNSRNPREKKMFVAVAVMAIIAFDYLLLINPVIGLCMRTTPKLTATKSQLQELKDNQRNKVLIDRSWETTNKRLTAAERGFVASDELPALLENLSKLAQDSGVKIISLKPIENVSKADKERRYHSIPIAINASSGTHELGRLLSKLESGPTFFRVTDIKIAAESADIKRHSIQLDLETFGRGDNNATH